MSSTGPKQQIPSSSSSSTSSDFEVNNDYGLLKLAASEFINRFPCEIPGLYEKIVDPKLCTLLMVPDTMASYPFINYINIKDIQTPISIGFDFYGKSFLTLHLSAAVDDKIIDIAVSIFQQYRGYNDTWTYGSSSETIFPIFLLDNTLPIESASDRITSVLLSLVQTGKVKTTQKHDLDRGFEFELTAPRHISSVFEATDDAPSVTPHYTQLSEERRGIKRKLISNDAAMDDDFVPQDNKRPYGRS